MNKSSFGSTLFSFLTAFALLWEASGHMHDTITSLAASPDGEWLFTRSRFWLLRSQDKGNSWTPLRNPDDIYWEKLAGGAPNFILSPDFNNDGNLLFGSSHSTDFGDTWSTDLEEKLTRRKRKGIQFEICTSAPQNRDVNPVVFSADFANDKTIFILACQEENPTLATLFYSKDLGETFKTVTNLEEFEIGSWIPVLTATTDELYFHKVTGLNSEIFMPTSGDSTTWQNVLTLENFEIQSISEDQSSDGILVIERNSQTIYRLNLDADEEDKLIPITLPSAATPESGDRLLITAYIHKGVGTNTSMFVLRSTCPGRDERLRQLGVECPSTVNVDRDQRDVVLHSTDEGTTWKNQSVSDWFCLQGGGESLDFKQTEFTFVLGIPGTPTMFLGTFTGVYRSEDNGESWEELDTIATDIIGMDAIKISPDNIQLSVCTYDDFCRSGAIDIGPLRDGSISRLPEGSLEKVMRSTEEVGYTPNSIFSVYSTIAFADGIGILSDKIGIMRYANGFNGTYTNVDSIAFVVSDLPGKLSTVHGIEFSPNFENDDTMFIAGFNLDGVFRSVDRGLTFENVFNTSTLTEDPIRSDSVALIVSPDFESTGVVFTYVTDGNKPKGPNPISLLYISEDYGSNWTAVDQGEDPPRMTSIASAINNAQEGEYSLVANDANGDIWVNRRRGPAREFGEWAPLLYRVNGDFTPVLPKKFSCGEGIWPRQRSRRTEWQIVYEYAYRRDRIRRTQRH